MPVSLRACFKGSDGPGAGETFAAMTKGLCEILAARASTKQEFRIDRTVIGAAP